MPSLTPIEAAAVIGAAIATWWAARWLAAWGIPSTWQAVLWLARAATWACRRVGSAAKMRLYN